MAISFMSVRKQENLDRQNLTRNASPVDLFNRAHGYNYLVAVLVGKTPKRKQAPDVYDQIIKSTVDANRQFVFGNKRIRAKKTHTLKRNKGSSSSHLSKRFALHLVEDCLQSAFLFYWENRSTKTYLQHTQGTREEASQRITRLCCRAALLEQFRKDRIRSARGAHGENKFRHSIKSFAALKNNDDMLLSEEVCDTLAEKLGNDDPKITRIVRATMGKTSKKKCLARALRCSRPTLDAQLKKYKKSVQQYFVKGKEKQTVAFLPMAPIGQAPETFKPIATVPSVVPGFVMPIAPWARQEQEQEETATLSTIIRARMIEEANREQFRQEQKALGGWGR
jgi:hypothetical protein